MCSARWSRWGRFWFCWSRWRSYEDGRRMCALAPCGRGQRRRFNKHGWVRGCGPTPHPFLPLDGRVALSRKGRGRNNDAPDGSGFPRAQKTRAAEQRERDQRRRDGEPEADGGDGGGGGPADRGECLGERGDPRGDLAAAELAALGLGAEPKLNGGR